jgi:polysaccharide export outer membrane protein
MRAQELAVRILATIMIALASGALPGRLTAQALQSPTIVAAPGPASVAPATPSDYVIGPEDVLGVLFWRDQEMSGDILVRPDGRITLPLIGEMQAAGVRPEVLRGQIQAAADKYLSDTNVTVVVRQINSRKVYITGEVTTPGSYPITGPRSVMQLIALAGGVSEYADSNNISIMRIQNGQTVIFKFSYKDVAKGKKLEQNIPLQPGDTVVVP